MTKNRTITSTSFLAVEGKDEKNFFVELLKDLSINDVQVADVGGKDKFQNELSAWSIVEKFSKINRFAFIRDAEDKPAYSAFQSICSILNKLEIPQPESINSIYNDNLRKVGIFIMPDNTIEGMLENLCIKTICGSPVADCVDNYILCISQHLTKEEEKKFNKNKSRVQVFLSSKVPIVNSLGIAAQKGYWDFSHDCFDNIKNFLRDIFA